jgi:hypothetical protein
MQGYFGDLVMDVWSKWNKQWLQSGVDFARQGDMPNRRDNCAGDANCNKGFDTRACLQEKAVKVQLDQPVSDKSRPTDMVGELKRGSVDRDAACFQTRGHARPMKVHDPAGPLVHVPAFDSVQRNDAKVIYLLQRHVPQHMAHMSRERPKKMFMMCCVDQKREVGFADSTTDQ